ncbi:hypothetical protein [Mesorhizobium sp. LjNodule214]|uniref:hypothetical protein n=1 Tax=Mesorhizobium sp. LjNodule214 TaxID=3342252 RepID=UPI003ECEF3A5
MATRTTQTVAFRLPGFEAWQPAGDYRVDHDEESIEGILQACLATRRRVHSPAGNRPAEFGATVQLSPADLDAAREKDLG